MASVAKPWEPEFGQGGALRQSFGERGRVHIDRWLPFLMLNRSEAPSASIARRIAVNAPAYLVWTPDDDEDAERTLEAVGAALRLRFGSMLTVELEEGPWEPVIVGSQSLPPFLFRVATSDSEAARAAGEALVKSLNEVEIDLRPAEVELSTEMLSGGEPDRIRIVIPPIHRASPKRFYPQLTHELAAACSDSLLKAACNYMATIGAEPPEHYRALGRSAFLAAALDADRKLDRVAKSFDFLLSISPINGAEAIQTFFAEGEQKPPTFRYRPLTVDPDAAKRDLYAVDLNVLEDPLLERLLAEKRQEIDHQLTMLATRNTTAFKAASLLHYGPVSTPLLADARAILAAPLRKPAAAPRLGASEVAQAAQRLISHYQAIDPSFAPEIQIRDDVGGLMVSGGRLMIATNASVSQRRIDALLAHEVSIHLLTHYNGAAQGLTVFRTGLAHYEGVQEGLGVFAEWAVGGLTATRLRLLAGRVIAVSAMLDGADFIQVYRLMVDDCGLAKRPAFEVALRVFRSGGFAKDFIYLQGFRTIVERVAAGHSLVPFWIGKIAPGHAAAIEELLQRRLVHPPRFTPEFLERDDAQKRIARAREGVPFESLFPLE
ncbi:MAG TPA: tyrosine/phenylalanine carboxypeptidase domain-containing protein [Allosphingosinicella sp.]|nr:tyrosine/phenylalanine carboxypeptidase domain-containing protein [Allosphingosinicella sp.]